MQSNNISCIYVTLGKAKRSGNVVGHKLSKQLNWDCYDNTDLKFEDYDNLRQHSTLFLFNHRPSFYTNRGLIGADKDIVNCRHNHIDRIMIGRKCINSISYYNNFPYLYQSFFPTIVAESFPKKEKNNIALGYYFRDIRYDGAMYFIDNILNKLNPEIPIYILGISDFPYITNRKIECTFDPDYFFDHITHYFYFKSNIILDPFPHTLLEAVLRHCTIVVPENKRSMNDGIDDILSLLGSNYISKIENNFLDKEYDINLDLTPIINYQKSIVESNFTLMPDKSWKTLYDLMSHI